MRISKKDLEELTDQLNIKEGRPRESHHIAEDGTRKNNIGHVMLDHAACYGGYALRVLTDGTGESFYYPSWERISGREMFYFLMGKLHEGRIYDA